MSGNMMKQVQKMQRDMLRLQEELEAKEYTASGGGGAVTVTVSGKRELLSITITPEAAEDVDMLQDLILVTVNDGLRTAENAMSQAMGRFTGGMKLPF